MVNLTLACEERLSMSPGRHPSTLPWHVRGKISALLIPRHHLCRRSPSQWRCKRWPRLRNLSRWSLMLCAILRIGSGLSMPFLERDSRKSSQAAHWVSPLAMALPHNLRVEACMRCSQSALLGVGTRASGENNFRANSNLHFQWRAFNVCLGDCLTHRKRLTLR